MTWFTQTANADEAVKEHVHMFLAVAIDLPSGIQRLWSGYGDLSFGGFTYTGIGTFGQVAVGAEHTRLLAEKKSFRLSGVDPSLMPEADIDGSFGRSITEYFGFLDTNAGVLIAMPEINWEGRIDSIIRCDGPEPFLEITAENRMVYLDLPNGWRYTHEHQQQFFPGDDGLKLVPTTETTTVHWGGSLVKAGIPGARAGVADRARAIKAGK